MRSRSCCSALGIAVFSIHKRMKLPGASEGKTGIEQNRISSVKMGQRWATITDKPLLMVLTNIK